MPHAVSRCAKAMEFFAELLDRDDVFLWSYETMSLYGCPYFQRLHRFLNVESDFIRLGPIGPAFGAIATR